MSEVAKALEELQRQVQLLLDEREITRVLLALSRTVDEKDFEGLASLYAVDGTLVTPWGSHSGRNGLAEYVRKDLGHFHALHHVGAGYEIQVEPAAATATARMTLLATHVSDADGSRFTTVGGYYNIELVREEGKWRFKRVAPCPQWRFNASGQETAIPDGNERWLPDGETTIAHHR
jgi:uncharacterized protein (TIGR02246 family)